MNFKIYNKNLKVLKRKYGRTGISFKVNKHDDILQTLEYLNYRNNLICKSISSKRQSYRKIKSKRIKNYES